MKADLEQIQEILTVASALTPMADAVADILEQYGPALRRVASGFNSAMTDLTIQAFNQYIQAGFSRDEAILLVISNKNAMAEQFRKMRTQ